MNLLRSAVFNFVVFGSTAVLYVAYAPTLLLPSAVTRRCVTWWFDRVFRLQRAILGLDFEFRGLGKIPDGAFIIASAHQSAWETIGFFAVADSPVYVLKEELTRLPLFRAYMRAFDMIAIDRSGSAASARRMLDDAAAVLASGRPVVIFPGGTRSEPGADFEIRPGVGALYRRCGVPVVPVSLNTGLYWRRRTFTKKPGTMIVEFGSPIEPGLDRRRFETLLAERIKDGNLRLLDRPA